jgi:hypothetical protein
LWLYDRSDKIASKYSSAAIISHDPPFSLLKIGA